jgi:hypothetical protein
LNSERPHNILNGYTVTNKADGQRCFLTVMRDKRMLRIQPNGTVTWTGMMAVVFGVIAASILEGSMFKVAGSMSTNTGLMPFQRSEWAVATNE